MGAADDSDDPGGERPGRTGTGRSPHGGQLEGPHMDLADPLAAMAAGVPHPGAVHEGKILARATALIDDQARSEETVVARTPEQVVLGVADQDRVRPGVAPGRENAIPAARRG
jgi:hypothetical protein